MIQEDIYEYSNPEIIRQLGRRYKEYRLRLGVTQQQVAEKVGLSIYTVSQFEQGRAGNLTMDSLLRLLRGIGYLEEMNKLLEPLPISPILQKKLAKQQRKRVRTKNRNRDANNSFIGKIMGR